MRDPLYVHAVQFRLAGAEMRASGLLGWVSFKLAKTVVLGGVAARKTADGRYTLSFPEHRDGHGTTHSVVRPCDQAARDSIERQVFAALREMGIIP